MKNKLICLMFAFVFMLPAFGENDSSTDSVVARSNLTHFGFSYAGAMTSSLLMKKIGIKDPWFRFFGSVLLVNMAGGIKEMMIDQGPSASNMKWNLIGSVSGAGMVWAFDL